jgi:hypothetical protein
VSVGDWFDLPHRSARRYFQDGVPGMDYPRSDLPNNVTFVGSLVPAPKELPPELAAQLRDHRRGPSSSRRERWTTATPAS